MPHSTHAESSSKSGHGSWKDSEPREGRDPLVVVGWGLFQPPLWTTPSPAKGTPMTELETQPGKGSREVIVCTKSPPPLPPPYPPPTPPPPPPPSPPHYLPPLPSARFAQQTARFARRGGQPPHPP